MYYQDYHTRVIKTEIARTLFKCLRLLIILLMANISTTFAQSDNYWSWNFNTKSALLAGSVVGGGEGPSSVYYNPSLIDHGNMQSLSLSAVIASLQFYNVDNLAGNGIDANKVLFKIQPRFLSYALPNKNDRIGTELAILSPVSEEVQYTIQHIDEIDIINRTQGQETYSGYLKYARKYTDTWVGGGFSYKVSERFYVGGSAFLSIKLLKYQYQQVAKAYQEVDSVLIKNEFESSYIAQSGFEEEFKYWYLSLIFKAGAYYNFPGDQFSIGLNITLPDIPIYGEADIRKSFIRSNIYENNESAFVSNENSIGVEESLKGVRVKNPFSIALGAQYSSKNRKNFVTITAEYFHNIDAYPLIKSSTQLSWTPNNVAANISDNDYMSYYFKAKAVTNLALGFKKQISTTLAFMGGFRTDFTASNEGDTRYTANKFSVIQVHMNKYHITSGMGFKIKDFTIISGLQYTFGRNKNMEQLISYTEPVEYNPNTQHALEGIRQNNTHAQLNEFSLFLGVSVSL